LGEGHGRAPRPAKIHKGESGLGLVSTAATCSLLGFGLACAAVTIYLLNGSEFIGQVPDTNITIDGCPNGADAVCNIGTAAQRCCQPGLKCVQTALTHYTCQQVAPSVLTGLRDSYSVAQAFLALYIGSSCVSYVFFAIALAPNGAMDIKIALSVGFALAIVGAVCGIITFSVLQGYILGAGLSGMPRECGYLLGGFVAEMVAAGCGFCAWLPYHDSFEKSQEDQLWEAERGLEIEQIKLQTIKIRAERTKLEKDMQAMGDNRRSDDGEEEKTTDTLNMNTAADLQAT